MDRHWTDRVFIHHRPYRQGRRRHEMALWTASNKTYHNISIGAPEQGFNHTATGSKRRRLALMELYHPELDDTITRHSTPSLTQLQLVHLDHLYVSLR
jgi:hypothetical protein